MVQRGTEVSSAALHRSIITLPLTSHHLSTSLPDLLSVVFPPTSPKPLFLLLVLFLFFLALRHTHSPHRRVLHFLLSACVLRKVLPPPTRALLGLQHSIKPGEAVASARTPRKSLSLASSSHKSTFSTAGTSASLTSRSEQ